MSSMLHWIERQQLICANPLKHVERVRDRRPREFRRALLLTDAQRLLSAAPSHRATVYLTILYTGLRSAELKGLTWGDFDFDTAQPCVRVPSSISKNRKASVHGLHPQLVVALQRFKPVGAKSTDWAFRGIVPRVPTFKRDLQAAGIPFEDHEGRRIDIHALRKSFGTMLAVNGVSLRTCMELMRHSESRLTEKVYTDASHLPLQSAVDALPSLYVPPSNSLDDSLRAVSARPLESSAVIASHVAQITQAIESVTVGHEKAPQDDPRRFPKMERAKRLELNDLQIQQGQHVMDTATPPFTDTATVTPGLELAEIIATWTKLPPEIRTAVLTLIRM